MFERLRGEDGLNVGFYAMLWLLIGAACVIECFSR